MTMILRNPLIRWLLVLNVLVLVGLGVKKLLAPGAARSAEAQALDRVVAGSARRGLLGKPDLRRVFEISKSVTARRAVSDPEMDELFRMPERSPGGVPAQDVASMYALGALTGAQRFTPAQTARLSPFLLARLDDAEHHPVSAPLAMVFAFKARDGVAMAKVRELAKSPIPSVSKVANKVLDRYRVQG